MFVHEVEKQEYFVSELCFREENKMKRKHLTEHGSMIEKEIQLFFLFFLTKISVYVSFLCISGLKPRRVLDFVIHRF